MLHLKATPLLGGARNDRVLPSVAPATSTSPQARSPLTQSGDTNGLLLESSWKSSASDRRASVGSIPDFILMDRLGRVTDGWQRTIGRRL